jgi:nitrogen-specific signal transduction histidine kinase
VEAVIEMSTNITEVKKGQKELKTLGQSIALLSHGIKNILEGLEGVAYAVDEGLRDNDMHLARKGWNTVKKISSKSPMWLKTYCTRRKTVP